MRGRTHCLLVFLGLALIAASGLTSIADAQGGKLRFGMGPLQPTPSETKKAYEPFFAYLAKELSALENVLVGRLADVPTWRVILRRFKRSDRQLALGCLDTVGLVDRAGARADELSGGQQQRVAIARALAQDAKIILADEPVASLDPESSATVLASLRSAVSTGVTVIASLHQVHLARAYADRIVALRDGRLVEDAGASRLDARTIEQIYEKNGERSEA
jgi:ABC-type phosphate/phosphonate transport system ATPase subunit